MPAAIASQSPDSFSLRASVAGAVVVLHVAVGAVLALAKTGEDKALLADAQTVVQFVEIGPEIQEVAAPVADTPPAPEPEPEPVPEPEPEPEPEPD